MHRSVLSLPPLFILSAAQVRAQELEPRVYSPNPVGANYVLAGYPAAWPLAPGGLRGSVAVHHQRQLWFD